MYSMFRDATAFDQDITGWSTPARQCRLAQWLAALEFIRA
jgi:hypothetical protein